MTTINPVNPATAVPSMAPAPTPAAMSMHPSGSLYVGDLAPDVTEAMLFEVFNRTGAVSSIRVCRDATTRRSLGYAYVNYHSVVDAERALDTLNYTTIKDRPCRIMWSHRDPSTRKNSKSNVFVKNLAPTIDSKMLFDTFSTFGNILSCKVATDPMTGSSRGFGYVHFETEESALKAIEGVNGHVIEEKPVYVGHFERRTERTAGPSKFTNVYVNNVPAEWDEKRLEAEFSRFGKVTSVALRAPPAGKFNGRKYGFVNFETHEEAVKAVEGGKTMEFDGIPLFCDRFQKRTERMQVLGKKYEEKRRVASEQNKDRNLYVKNLEDDVDKNKLMELFAPFGNILSAVVMLDEKKMSRGFGFVCFERSEDADKAIKEMNGKILEGPKQRPLYVGYAQRKEDRRIQLEQVYLAGQRMQPVMYYPPNMPMGATPYIMQQPPFRRMPPAPQMRYPQQPFFAPMPGPAAGAMRGRGRGMSVPPQQRGGYVQGGMPGRGRGNPAGMPQQPYPPRQAQAQAPRPMMHQELTSSGLASATPEQQKQILGERLYPLVYAENPALAAKITGMFLEMDVSECLQLLEEPNELKEKVAEAMRVLEQAGVR